MKELKAIESAYVLGLVDEEIATENFITDKIRAVKDKIKARINRNKGLMRKLEEYWKRDSDKIKANINNLINGIKKGDEWKDLPWNSNVIVDEEEGVLYIQPFENSVLNGKLLKKWDFKNEDARRCYNYILQKLDEGISTRNRKDDQSDYTLDVKNLMPNYIAIIMDVK